METLNSEGLPPLTPSKITAWLDCPYYLHPPAPANKSIVFSFLVTSIRSLPRTWPAAILWGTIVHGHCDTRYPCTHLRGRLAEDQAFACYFRRPDSRARPSIADQSQMRAVFSVAMGSEKSS